MTKNNNTEFNLESEMIPIIIDGMFKEFKYQYHIEEFETGNGIPDIVFAKGLNHRFYKRMDYESYYFMTNLLEKKIVHVDLSRTYSKKYHEVEKYLIKNKYIERINEYTYIRKKTFKPIIDEIIAVEAKLSDWKGGFHQASKYTYFANKSYLALCESKIRNVDMNLLKINGIGLISVNKNNIEIIIEPKNKKPLNMVSFLYSSQKIHENIYAV